MRGNAGTARGTNRDWPMTMLRIGRLFGVLSVVALVACSSGGAQTGESSEGALHESGNGGTKSQTLLRCNVFESGGGPDQEVTVTRAGESLTLVELTNSGSTVSRELSADEWQSRVIQLRKEDPDEENTLTKEGHSWRNESKGGGFRTLGYADCSIDTTN